MAAGAYNASQMAEWWRRGLESYRGRLMRCAPGVHAAAAALLERHAHVPPDARVLDLASGTGAFLARLRDSGYTNLAAVELNVEGFDLEGVTPQAVDLNSSFAADGALPRDSFDLVTAIEIIEHLDSPRLFLRNVHALLHDGGHLLLTTPNVAAWLGRARFLLSGELRQFQRHDYDHQRHISPTTQVQMRLIFEEVGFELVAMKTAGTFFGPVKQAVFAPIALLARMMWGNEADGDVIIYLARKTRPRLDDSAGRDSFYFRTTGA
jgi:2-polyprenyl-3-methyl-5-hydroxy-6-metoxy-1,4-benzoquinol methylase